MKIVEKMKDVLKEFESNPLVEKIRADKKKEILVDREAAAARIKAAEEELEKVLPGLQRAVEAAEAALKAHDEKRKALAEKAADARMAAYHARLHRDAERSAAEAVLLETYDPAVDEAYWYFADLHSKLRNKDPHVQRRTGEKFVNEKKEQFIFSNVPAINAALECCRAAMKEIESMKFKPAFDAARIEELKAGVPDVNALTEKRVIVNDPSRWLGA